MKKFFVIIILALCASNLFAQKELYNDIIYPDGGTKGNRSVTYWSKYNLYYYIHNSASNNLTSTQCQTAIQNAFNKWAQISRFTFTQTYNLSQADIELSWEPTNHSGCVSFGPNDLAHSTLGQIDQTPPAFIHFNDDITFTMTLSGYNLEYVALHEIGHVLGLTHDSHSDAVMYDTYEYKPDLSYYDLIALYNIYGFYSIIGPQLVYANATYYIDNLSSDLTVEWSLSNSYYNQNCLQQNYPSTNQCRITRSSSQNMMNATLTAAIKYNGVTIRMLTKTGVYAYADFYGQYTSGNLSGNIDYTHLFYVKPNNNTYITSPNFYGATVTYDYTGTIPNNWGFSPQNGYLQFIMPSNNNGTPILINVYDGCGNYYQLYAMPMNSKNLNISSDDTGITVTLNEDGESERGLILDQTWTVEIRNATTGALMATQSSVSRSTTIATSGWPKGLYVVKATIGKEVLTEKVIVI